jgi:hypothetical protein
MTSTPESVAAEPANLTEFILAEVHRQTSEEAIRSLVEQKIGSTIKAAVENAFRSFGDVGKQIEKVVTAALQIGGELDVPSYGNMVMAVLRVKMDEVLSPLVNERLAAEMGEILNLAPKQVELSDLVKTMIGECDRQDRWGSSVTCIVEESVGSLTPGYRWIYLDQEQGKSKHACEAQIGVDPDGKIFSLTIDRKDAKTTVVLGAYEDWKKQLFAAYCCGSRLVVDEQYVDTGIGDN